MAALYGREHGVYVWWARGIGVSEDTASRCLRGKGGRKVPQEWTAIVELLEMTPEKDWPERWKR